MLTDIQLKEAVSRGDIYIEPYNEGKVKAGKYDIHLGKFLLKPKITDQIIDPTDPKTQPTYEKVDIQGEAFVLYPREFVLGQTLELIGLNSEYGMFLDGSTTLARLGITIHQSANYVPPGQDPHILTLEIFNASPWKIKLSYGMRVGKVVAFKYSKKNKISAKDYNRYNAQKETTGAVFSENNDS